MLYKMISLFLLIFFCVVGLTAIHQVDKEQMWNITSTSLHNSMQNASKSFQINPEANTLNDIIVNIIYKIVDTLLYVIEQVSLIAGRLAIENPQINFQLILWLVILCLLAPIIITLIRILIIIYIFIKEFRDERKYKKQMKELQ